VIAQRVGYDSKEAFSRAFKREQGASLAGGHPEAS
jgi:AraC-like DNA-binding protein